MRLENIDALIIPAFATCAFKAEDAPVIDFVLNVNMITNLLGYCVGTIPITVVKEGETYFEEPFHNDSHTKAYRNSMKGSIGMPVGLTIACPPWKDEKCLGIMKLIEAQVEFSKKHPFPKY